MKYCGICGEPWDGKAHHLHGNVLGMFDQETGKSLIYTELKNELKK